MAMIHGAASAAKSLHKQAEFLSRWQKEQDWTVPDNFLAQTRILASEMEAEARRLDVVARDDAAEARKKREQEVERMKGMPQWKPFGSAFDAACLTAIMTLIGVPLSVETAGALFAAWWALDMLLSRFVGYRLHRWLLRRRPHAAAS